MLLLCSSRRSLPIRLLAQWNLYCLNGAQENGTNGLFPNRAERRNLLDPFNVSLNTTLESVRISIFACLKARGSERGRVVVTPQVAAGRLRRRSRPLWAAVTQPQHACGLGRSQAGAGRVRGSDRAPQLWRLALARGHSGEPQDREGPGLRLRLLSRLRPIPGGGGPNP